MEYPVKSTANWSHDILSYLGTDWNNLSSIIYYSIVYLCFMHKELLKTQVRREVGRKIDSLYFYTVKEHTSKLRNKFIWDRLQ